MSEVCPAPSTPKRASTSASGKAAWYTYYAGFSPRFVLDVIHALRLNKDTVIADPWNGAGTTTQVAHDHGYSALGYDLNPTMVIVGKARLLERHTKATLALLCSHILWKASQYYLDADKPDPLASWFTPRSVSVLRSIDRALQDVLLHDHQYLSIANRRHLAPISSLVAFFYVGLFRTVRQLLITFRTTNPTWLKVPCNSAARLRPSSKRIRALFRRQITSMATALSAVSRDASRPPFEGQCVDIRLADSRSLPLLTNSVDAVIGSPPYCTRIDYTLTTRPELALLGYDTVSLRELRSRMIGSTTINKPTPSPDSTWGPACNAFLKRVRLHKSRASDTYYWKNHVQYFDGLHGSLSEIRRVLRPGAPCVLVLQDSYYKELHNDLPAYVTEMAGGLGLSLKHRYDYTVEHTLAALHAHRKTYRSHARATESVLWFVRI